MRILIIDDEPAQCESLRGFLQHLGHSVVTAADGQSGLQIVTQQALDVVFTDFRMPGLDGVQVVEEIRKRAPLIKTIVITAFGEIELAVTAMKAGAYDFITKPIDLDQVELLLRRIAEHVQVLQENRRLRELLERDASFDSIVSASPAMEHVLNLAARVADSASSILICGETGVGKELVARAIHMASPRRDRPFVAVNCSALNEHLLESELFGHEKGAFTGAISSRIGRFEHAAGGTLFLDEIGDLPPSVQVKLLRALQEKTIERVGSNTPITVDVRLIAATHRNLTQEMAAGRFREDLYYRLNVVTIWVPPLRERREDIPVLAHRFLEACTRDRHKLVKGFTPEAMDILTRYHYPGNVRELQNAVERAVLLTRTEYIQPCDLPENFLVGGPYEPLAGHAAITLPLATNLPEAVERLEKAIVLHALKETGGNQTRAARRIGISEKSVRDRLKKWGLSHDDHSSEVPDSGEKDRIH
ncbi:MAG: sigma-54 dependent transcriptional regulator [bacterium]|nr:sigma-54 dependent transcriptional regulator [bacterium]